VKKLEQVIHLDPWLSLEARLADGTRVSVDLVDKVRDRTVTKKSASGKTKVKKKEKLVRRIDVEVAGDAGMHDLVVPTPPPRLPVYTKPGASRPTVTARFDHRLPAPDDDAVRLALKVLGEAHRHVQPRRRG